MTRFEKWLVNRENKARRNIARIRQRLAALPSEMIKDVLELGCGIGDVAAFLSKTDNMKVWGTDYDQAQIQIARKRHPENEYLNYRVEDAERLSFQDACFDLVVLQNDFCCGLILPSPDGSGNFFSRLLKITVFIALATLNMYLKNTVFNNAFMKDSFMGLLFSTI